MPFDDTSFDYGGHGMPEKGLTLKGVYKLQALRSADYCVYGTINGQEFLIPELSLKKALRDIGTDTIACLEQAQRVGKNSDPVFLGIADIRCALTHIAERAPANRPDPLVAVS